MELGTLVNPFPLLTKGTKSDIDAIIKGNDLYSDRNYRIESLSISSLLASFKKNRKALLFSQGTGTGYPVDIILKAVAFLIADQSALFGQRIRGGYLALIKKHINLGRNQSIIFRIPDLLTPIIIENNDRAALVGPVNPTVYQRLTSFDQNTPDKLYVRQVTEEDLR